MTVDCNEQPISLKTCLGSEIQKKPLHQGTYSTLDDISQLLYLQFLESHNDIPTICKSSGNDHYCT